MPKEGESKSVSIVQLGEVGGDYDVAFRSSAKAEELRKTGIDSFEVEQTTLDLGDGTLRSSLNVKLSIDDEDSSTEIVLRSPKQGSDVYFPTLEIADLGDRKALLLFDTAAAESR